jgi:adhesin transport system membrane fusion protein
MSSELRPEDRTATRTGPDGTLLPSEATATMLPAEAPPRRVPMRRPPSGLPAIRPRPGVSVKAFDAGSRMPALHQVGTPKTARKVGVGVIFVCIITPFLMALIPWRQSVFGDGQVIAFHPLDREYQVFSPLHGRVTEFYVIEGDRVEAGEMIAKVENIDPEFMQTLKEQLRFANLQLDAANTKVKQYKAALKQKKAEKKESVLEAEEAIEATKQRITGLDRRIDETETDVKGFKWKYEQVKALYERGLEAGQAVIAAEQTYRTTERKLEQAEAALEQAKRELKSDVARKDAIEAKAEAEVQKAETDVQTAMVDVQNYENKLQELNVRIRQQREAESVVASRSGTVLRILTNVGTGAQVKEGDPLAIIIPNAPRLAAEVYLPGRDVPLVQPGDPVRLQFEGWPALQFVGWPAVAVGTFPGKVALVDASETRGGRFRVLAVPDLGGPTIHVYGLEGAYFTPGSTVTGLESGTTATVETFEIDPKDPSLGTLTITGIDGEFLADEPIQDERNMQARVRNPWPSQQYLRQGARANGWVLLREVPLGFEIWRRLNGFAPIVSENEPSDKDDKPKVKRPK